MSPSVSLPSSYIHDSRDDIESIRKEMFKLCPLPNASPCILLQ